MSGELKFEKEDTPERVKGLKIGEVFLCLNDNLLDSIKKHGLLTRKEVESRRQEGGLVSTEETDQAHSPRRFITEGNKIVDSFKPDPSLPSREDSVFAFVFRGKLDPPSKPEEGARSTLLIRNLSGKEFVADGAFMDEVVGRLQCIEEGVPDMFAGMPGSGKPAGMKNKLPEAEIEKWKARVNEVARQYWDTLVPLDEFLTQYSAKGKGSGKEMEDWTNDSNPQKVFHYPEIIIPHAVNPEDIELAVEYIHGKELKIHNEKYR